MFVVWLTGISGAGKTTIAGALRRRFAELLPGRSVEVIDGDEVRRFFSDTGYTRADRINHIKRIVFAAKLLQRNGVPTIVANIAPYREIRDFARAQIDGYVQVYVQCPVEECERRDVKGLYASVRKGELRNFIGKDDAYEEPRDPSVIVHTADETVAESVDRILGFLRSQGFIGGTG